MRKQSLRFAVIAAVLTLVLAGAGIFFLCFFNNIADEVIIEAGSTPSASDFLIRDWGIPVAFETVPAASDLAVPGVYPVVLSYNGRSYTASVRVRDTIPPVGETRPLTVYSTQSLRPEDFIAQARDATRLTVSYITVPDLTRAGEQTVRLALTDAGENVTVLEATLTVIVDDAPPVITGVGDLRLYPGQAVDYLAGVRVTDDHDPNVTVSVDDSAVDLNLPGVYPLIYSALDFSGNRTEIPVSVTVILDVTPPVLYGAEDRSLCVGSTIAYRSGVLVTDDTDANPILTIDSSAVDLSRPGTYPLIYRAQDGAGNVTIRETTVTVYEKLYYFVDEAVIYAKADAIIAEIITDDMTVEEQVWAIYRWIRANYSFNGWADKIDWKQNAYEMLRTGKGDCYSFFALSKLLFERLGIPNLDVQRLRTPEHEGDHYWNMVSTDGGKTWYHYDSTPFLTPDEMCLVTDARLDAFSAQYWNCYHRDRSAYPATP